MISVFLPVEDYCLNYESKVENSFVNAIPPQKSLSLPLKKYLVSSHSHPRRSPRKTPAYLPASPPSYPEESSQSLPEKKRPPPPPHFHPHQKGTPLYAPASPPANTLAKQSPPPLPPSQRIASIYSNDPPQNLTNSPPFGPLQNEQNERRKHPPLHPPTNAPFLWVLPPHLRAYSKPSFSPPQNNPTVGRRKNLL